MATAKRSKGSTREKKEEEGKPPPHVTARNVGSMGKTVDNPVETLRAENPDKEYRYVYAPDHRSDYSKLIQRRSQGYSPVDAEEAGIEHIHGQAGNDIRVGDVILCEIPKDMKEQREEELAERARDDARRSQEVYEQHVRRNKRKGVGATPIGSVERTSREYSVEMEE